MTSDRRVGLSVWPLNSIELVHTKPSVMMMHMVIYEHFSISDAWTLFNFAIINDVNYNTYSILIIIFDVIHILYLWIAEICGKGSFYLRLYDQCPPNHFSEATTFFSVVCKGAAVLAYYLLTLKMLNLRENTELINLTFYLLGQLHKRRGGTNTTKTNQNILLKYQK